MSRVRRPVRRGREGASTRFGVPGIFFDASLGFFAFIGDVRVTARRVTAVSRTTTRSTA